jgi:hypothetical protein
MTKRKKKNIPVVPAICSPDEAAEAVNSWYDRSPECDPYDCPDISGTHMERLKDLVRKIWEDAYAAGRSDARSDAAVEAAEAEWFNS